MTTHAATRRVVIAPDGFGGTLSAEDAAEAMAQGWRRVHDDDVELVPLSDGGPGLVDVLATTTGGVRRDVVVDGPLGKPVNASILLVEDTAYVESAQACGLHLVPPQERDALAASTTGVGQLVLAALDAGARRIVVGLGGSATTDGGAGMLVSLGAEVTPADLGAGGDSLAGVVAVDLTTVDARLQGVELIVATDVDNPLLGPTGAAAVFGPQKGASTDEVRRLDAALTRWAHVAASPRAAEVADRPGAGAAGGLGFGFYLLGARSESGISLVMDAVGLRRRLEDARLVLTGEGSFDGQSLRGKVVTGVAAVAAEADVPCLVLAGQVHVTAADLAAAGVAAAYAVADVAGSVEDAMARPFDHLCDLAQHVATTMR